MTDRVAMRLALETLEDIFGKNKVDVGAITALRAQLEQPEQEPQCPKCKAAVLYECVACSSNNYPTQRKPLTDEEISAASKGHMTRNGFARAIEAAHGIKETP